METSPIVSGPRHSVFYDPTASQPSTPHRYHTQSASNSNHKRPRSLSPVQVDDRNSKRRQNFNDVPQPTTPMLLSVLEESNSKFGTDTPPGSAHPYYFEPSPACHDAQQDVEMECGDEPHQHQHESMTHPDPRSLSWPVRSVHALRRATPPTGAAMQTSFGPPGSPPHNLRPQPLHRPHPAAYQQHLALFSHPRPACPPTNDMNISPSRRSHASHSGGIYHDQPTPERPSRSKNAINYMLGPKKGCEDCRRKVAGHYTHL